MKYQIVKHYKTKSKMLALYDSLVLAVSALKSLGARFESISYYGGFPTFSDGKNSFSIQGYIVGLGVVCSIPQREIESFTF